MNWILKLLKNQYLWLALIIILAFTLRLYKLDSQIADWHSWRQADTAAVARNFYKHGYNPFFPQGDDMSGVSEDKTPNVNRYRFVEFPISNTLIYLGYLLNGGVDVRIARMVSVLFSLGSTILLFFIVRRYFDLTQALIASFLYAILPYNVYFSRVVLPEPALVFFSLGMLYFTDRWIWEDKKWLFWVSVFFSACAFLTKPMAAFYALPLFYSYFQKERPFWKVKKRYIAFVFLALAPFAAWRIWMSFYPEGIPASKWLLNGTLIRFRPAFWRWIIGDRLNREILSVFGVALLILGGLLKPKVKESIIPHLLLLSSFLYLIVFATGNVQHDYYQYLIVPPLIIFVARGFASLLSGVREFLPRLFTIPIAIFLLGIMLMFTWYEDRGLYQINNDVIVQAGEKADEILPKDAVVVAPYNGDTSFLYAVNRPGFPFVYFALTDMIKNYHLTHFVSVNNDAKTAWVRRNYATIFDNGKFYIMDLTKPSPNQNPITDPEP